MLRAVLLALSAMAWSSSASGAVTTACSGPRVTVTLPEREAWRTLRSDLVEHLRALRDLDRCAEVAVGAAGDLLTLDVTTGDGRKASRQVASEAELLRASEALLTLPPALVQPPPPPLIQSPSELPPPEPERAHTEDKAHIELALGGSARMGGAPLFAGGGVAAFADVTLDNWLLGVSGRWDIADGLVTEPSLMDYFMTSTAVGVSLGRRFDLGNAALDALLGPNVVIENQDADDQDRDVHGSAADLRLDLGLRVSGPRSSKWRAFVALDAEVSPARVRKQRFADPVLPPLPSWSAGLALGVSWSAR